MVIFNRNTHKKIEYIIIYFLYFFVAFDYTKHNLVDEN